MLYDRQTNQTRELLPKFDAYVDDFAFTPDGKSIYFVSGERGGSPSSTSRSPTASMRKLIGGSTATFKISTDARLLVFTRSTAARPAEIYTARLDGDSPARLGRQSGRAADSHQRRAHAAVRAARRGGADVDGGGRRRRSRGGSSGRPTSTRRRSTRSSCSSTAGRRAPGTTLGATAGTRRSSRPPATSSSCPTRAARPASASSSRRDLRRLGRTRLTRTS